MNISFSAVELVEWCAVALSGSAIIQGIISAALALRAKRRAKHALSREIASSPALMQLQRSGTFNPAELRMARKAISRALDDLSERDKKRIEAGLNQSSKQGEKRYTEDLIKTA